MTREYFPSKFHLDNRARYFLWSSADGGDGVDRDQVWTRVGIAPTFATLADAGTFAREEVGVPFAQEGEPVLHDLTAVARWCGLSKQRRARMVDPSKALAAWNIFADLARGLDVAFVGTLPHHHELYFKVFWGNNLPSLTPPGQMFVPRWTGAQLQALHDVLGEGLKLWRGHVR